MLWPAVVCWGKMLRAGIGVTGGRGIAFLKIIVTGGAGFIGSAVCRYLVRETDAHVVNIDKLTYAANLRSLEPIANNPRYHFIRADICDRPAMEAAFAKHEPDAVMHLAAESHVDRSINGSDAFIHTNVLGTHTLLETARAYWMALPKARAQAFRFLHVSTDEVYGSLGPEGAFCETTAYDPSSPYSASKAAADHLASAWHRTFGLPVVISNCSNNYGPYHFPEKLIPLVLLNALDGKPLPVYGDGSNVRDWLYVDDHARALHLILTRGAPRREIQRRRRQSSAPTSPSSRASAISLDDLVPDGQSRRRLITFVARPARPRPSLCHRRHQAGDRARLARAGDVRDRPRQDRALVSRQPRLVGAAAQGRLRRRAARPGRDQGASRLSASSEPHR